MKANFNKNLDILQSLYRRKAANTIFLNLAQATIDMSVLQIYYGSLFSL